MSSLLRLAPAPARDPGTARLAGAGVAIALHLALLVWLLSYQPARVALLDAVPILIELVAPPEILPPKPPPPRVQPRVEPRPAPKPVEQPPMPLLSTPPEVSRPLAAPTPAPFAPPAPLVAPAPVVAPSVAAAPPAPIATTPPVFNASYLENPAPGYPAASRRLAEQGRVVLRVRVSSEGRAEELQIQTSSGHVRLDEAARETVRRWRFVPAKRGSEPVSAWVLIPVSFRLED